MITSGDRDDIQLGFDSLDIDVNGFLSMENVHALFLGLGYANEVDTYVSIDSLRKLAGRDALNLEETMELFGKVRYSRKVKQLTEPLRHSMYQLATLDRFLSLPDAVQTL